MDKTLNFQVHVGRALLEAPVPDAVGVALSYVLHCAYNHPDVLRRVLNEPVVREGFTGTSMLAVLNKVAR